MVQCIETVPYNKGFVLASEQCSKDNYVLVDARDAPVYRNKPLRAKDTHGRIIAFPWGTEVILLENL